MTLKPLDYVRKLPENGGPYQWYTTEPYIMYPASLQDLVDRRELTIDDALLGVTPRDHVEDRHLERRRNALEKARVHFLTCLIEEVGAGVGLHISRDPSWRLQ